jgi:hypothetical protein
MNRLRKILEFPKIRGKVADTHNLLFEDIQLVTQRKPLEEVEPFWVLRWLLRMYFNWRGFACRSHCGTCNGKCYASVSYRGAFLDKSKARWAAMCDGGAVKPIPFDAALPEETVSYKAGDVPMSEASAWYRKGVLLPFVSITRERLQELESHYVPDEQLQEIEERLERLAARRASA